MSGLVGHRGLLLRPPAGTAHNWWRLYNAAATGFVSVKELEFRTVATGSTTIDQTATGGTAFAINEYPGGYGPGNAFDGTFGGNRYNKDGTFSGPFVLGYHFPTPIEVVEVAVGDGGFAQDLTACDVQWSDDSTTGLDGTWTTVRSATFSFAVDTFTVLSVP